MIKNWSLYVVASAFVFGHSHSENDVMVSIFPSDKVILQQINDSLNLTCQVKLQGNQHKRNTLSWILPLETSHSGRINIFKKKNELTVMIQQLQESDSGTYICEVRGNGSILRHKTRVLVESDNNKDKCRDSFFSCGRGLCIPTRYVCDGYADCPGSEDESSKTCGKDPCEGKILCDDGRCISKNLCCDLSVDPDCPVVYIMPCCRKFIRGEIQSSISPLRQHHYSDINFLQSTIYTIVSCAIAFIFITTIMVVAICRIHMQRSVMSLHPSRVPRSVDRRWFWTWPWYQSHMEQARQRRGTAWEEDSENANMENEDRPFDLCNRTSLPPYPCPLSSHDHFVVMCKNASGMQLIECLPKPPPYTENLPSSSSELPPSYSESILPVISTTDESPTENDNNGQEQIRQMQ